MGSKDLASRQNFRGNRGQASQGNSGHTDFATSQSPKHLRASNASSAADMEWVYTSDQEEEPVLYEGNGQLEKRETDGIDTDSDVTAQTAEFFGDDVEEFRVPPTEAFSQLATLILGRHTEGEVKASAVVLENGKLFQGRKTSIAESREERIRRLRQEIEDLEMDLAPDAGSDAPNIFSTFRDQLNAVEQYTSSLSLSKRNGTHINVAKISKEGAIAENGVDVAYEPSAEAQASPIPSVRPDAKDGLTVNVYAANLASVLSLEERVGSLERVIGSSIHVEAQGTNVCKLMDEVRTKLELLSDVTCTERLKRDAEQVSLVLKHNYDSQSISEPLRLGTVLSKMEEWENVAAAVPTVVGRLRSLKRLHDEAGGFVSTVRNLSAKYESLLEANRENKDLVSTVRDNLATNLVAINANMALLESRLEALSNPT